MSSTRRRLVVVAVLTTVTSLASGCSSSPRKLPRSERATAGARSAPRTRVPQPSVAPATTAPPALAPLTGLPQPDPAQLAAPAVVVKVDNVDAARPQSGINQADVVYEELVEGGLTRLAAVYQSDYPTSVGPVRSGRLTDIAIVDDLNHPVLAFAGANGLFLPQLRAQPIDDIDMDNQPGLFRVDRSRAAPHNVYTNTATDAATDRQAGPPPALFGYRAAGTALTAAGAAPAGQVQLTWPSARVVWTYGASSGLWSRVQNGTPDVDASGAPVTAANVVIQAVPYVTSGIADEPLSGPTPIPEGELVGSGPAWILSGGRVAQGRWTRASLGAVTTYTDGAGRPVAVAPGRTWVELIDQRSAPVVH